jgi:hypothetical protein
MILSMDMEMTQLGKRGYKIERYYIIMLLNVCVPDITRVCGVGGQVWQHKQNGDNDSFTFTFYSTFTTVYPFSSVASLPLQSTSPSWIHIRRSMAT